MVARRTPPPRPALAMVRERVRWVLRVLKPLWLDYWVAITATVVVVAPTFTIVGGLLTLLALVSVYPLFLLACYGVAGWRAARAGGGVVPPRHAALARGGPAALRQTVVLLLLITALGLALNAWFWLLAVLLRGRPQETLTGLLRLEAIVVGGYLAGALVLGTLCAWLGAWLALRPPPRAA